MTVSTFAADSAASTAYAVGATLISLATGSAGETR